jgi:hypothetical protein
VYRLTQYTCSKKAFFAFKIAYSFAVSLTTQNNVAFCAPIVATLINGEQNYVRIYFAHLQPNMTVNDESYGYKFIDAQLLTVP